MCDDFCFATQGELVKFAFNAFGVMAGNQHTDLSGLDETQKGTIQKQLSRLAKEKGMLLPNFGEAIRNLSYILTAYLPNIQLIETVGDCLFDLHEAYSALVCQEGTFLNKQETLRYFISKHAIPVLVVSLNKSLFTRGLIDCELSTPDDKFWYLPTVDDGRIELPLAKVMRWAYERCGTSQTQFHFPGMSAKSDNHELQQNLASAGKWARGTSLPALPTLLHNFKESFRAQYEKGFEVPRQLQVSILVALAVARVASYVIRELEAVYGASYLEEVCKQYCDYATWIADDVNELKAELTSVMQRADSLETWFRVCTHYWFFFNENQLDAIETMQRLQNARRGQPIPSDVIEELQHKYGRFAVLVPLDLAKRQMQFVPPEGFGELLHRGFDLKNDETTQLRHIEEYAAQVTAYGLEELLCWMVPWLRAVFYYRQKCFQVAMGYFQTAFENAKYRAGENQYKLVNQYIEVSAKNDNRKGFKKGVEWAQYLGLEIRWLRKDEPTEEKLDFVFHMMKIARYDHQM